MPIGPLKLVINPAGWRLFMARKSDQRFKKYMHRILVRDNYTCQYCGFQAREFQEIINIDQNYNHNKLSNLATACCFCTQCLFVESVGLGGYGGGSLVYLPEIEQPSVNSFCHVLFCAITNDTGYRSSAQNIYRSLKYRSQVVESQFGEGSSNPSTFGQLYLDSGFKDQNTFDDMVKDLRVLPSRAKFRQQIERWAEAALQELSAEE